MNLTAEEIQNFPYVTPVQGNISTLELSSSILKKINDVEKGKDAIIDFTVNEMELLKNAILCLDRQCALTLPCLSLAKKILKG